MDKFVEICSGPIWLLLGIITLVNNSYPMWSSILFIIAGVIMSIAPVWGYLKHRKAKVNE